MGDKTDIQFSLMINVLLKIFYLKIIYLYLLKKNVEKNFNNNIIYEKCQKKKII